MMFVVHIKDFRWRLVAAALGCALVALAGVVLAGCLKKEAPPQSIPAASNEERLAYLRELGWQTSADPVETLDLQLPTDLAAEYAEYLALQDQQGLPFARFGGSSATRYTYTVENYPDYSGSVQINLYVSGGELIAADMIAPGENGFVRGVQFPQ